MISLAVCIAVCFGGFSVGAEEINKITFLGDSITTGYGLSEEELSYCDYLKNYFNAETENFARDGLTTEQLLEYLNESDIIESVKKSDIVCVSIGGNDLFSIFENALMDLQSNEISFSNSDEFFNVSSEFIQSFVIDYSSAFSSAAVKASENIVTIKDRIKEINPDAALVMQTVYIPFESSDEKKNSLLKPLKTYASLYIGTINTSIRNNAPNLADINLKFRENSYVYTNMDKFDIHPNYIGHMLIAEEIIQTLGFNGDWSIFKTASDAIPHGVFSDFPDYISDELEEFSAGQLRSGTLQQVIDKTYTVQTEASEEPEELTKETKKQTEITKEETPKKKGRRPISIVFLAIGFILIIITAFRRVIKNKKRKNK